MRAQEFDNPKEKFVDMFRKFLPLAMEIIGLKSLPKMIFEKEVESPEQPTFGQYVNDKHLLYVGLSNRHPNDILRTVAHELVHYKQDTEHKLNGNSGSTGSPEENEANSLAGIVMRNFNKLYPEYLKTKPIISESSLQESKSAPLYHFTTWNNLIQIILSNQLDAPSGKIYLTRDYNRQFIPHANKLFNQPYGLRLNQELLSRDYGRKLQAGGQDIGWDEKKRQDWLSDPKNAREIEIVKQTGRGSGSRYDGADPEDIVRGTIRQSRRWESEEHLNVKNLPNLDKYITGIVIGKAPIGSAHRTKELDPDPLTKLADTIIHLFSGPKGFDQRNWFLDSTAKLGVPIIYDRKEYDSAEVKKRIIQLYSQRKKEREEEQSKPQKDFMVITSPAGGGIVTGGSDINAVFNKLVKDPRHTNREIYGYSIGLGPNAEKKMFDQPIPLLQLVKNPQTQGITENFDKEANEYEEYLNRTKGQIMRFLAGVRGAPSEDDMLKAIAVAVDVMRRTGDIKQAAKAKQDYLLNISQNKQGVAENFADSLDNDKINLILTKLCKLILDQRKENSDLYGWVGACVLDENDNIVMSTSTKDNDKWRHAERNAVDKYIKKYGNISENSVIITTCSPCNESMKDRYGESCTDLINEIGIKTVYSGFTDPTQDEHHRQFDIIDTGDEKIKQLCRKFADKFLDLNENFADGRNPQDKGDSARHGIRKGMTIAQLKKIRSSDSASPRKKQLAHWQINMRQGRKK